MTILILLLFSFLFSSSYSLYKWEPRTLKCNFYDCQLLKNGVDQFIETECRRENERHICDIKCDGAERDSVISKVPSDSRNCSRFYTYNTQNTPNGKWYIWRDGICANSEIVLSVHCAFLQVNK